MEKKVLKLLYTVVSKDVELALAKSNNDETTKAVTDLKTKILEDFKMVSDLVGETSKE